MLFSRSLLAEDSAIFTLRACSHSMLFRLYKATLVVPLLQNFAIQWVTTQPYTSRAGQSASIKPFAQVDSEPSERNSFCLKQLTVTLKLDMMKSSSRLKTTEQFGVFFGRALVFMICSGVLLVISTATLLRPFKDTLLWVSARTESWWDTWESRAWQKWLQDENHPCSPSPGNPAYTRCCLPAAFALSTFPGPATRTGGFHLPNPFQWLVFNIQGAVFTPTHTYSSTFNRQHEKPKHCFEQNGKVARKVQKLSCQVKWENII